MALRLLPIELALRGFIAIQTNYILQIQENMENENNIKLDMLFDYYRSTWLQGQLKLNSVLKYITKYNIICMRCRIECKYTVSEWHYLAY